MRRNQTILGGAGPSAYAAAPAVPSLPRERIVYTTKTVREIGVGPVGLVHRSRGRPSNRRKPESVRERCLELCREQLKGCRVNIG